MAHVSRRQRRQLLGGLVLGGLALLATTAGAGGTGATPTFTKDVAPILYRNCAVCHRPGEAAPMSLLTYKDVRPWARSLREVVMERRMPPWFADPQHGEFANDRRLAQKDIDTLVAWVDGGAREGEAADLPPLPRFVDGWSIGTPDMVFTAEEFSVPADGVLPYQRFVVPTNFTEDRYIQAAEVRVSNRGVVHHAVVFIEEPERGRPANVDPARSQEHRLAGYAPGQPPLVLRPGVARLVKKGSVFVFDMHYTPNGTPGKDRTSVGIVFAKGPVEKRLGTVIVGTRNIDIPPGDPNYETRAAFAFDEDSHVESISPHMHSRGKDFHYRLVYPDGTSKVVLWVPRYDFNWQTTYVLKEPLFAPKGSRMECVAHFDNSTGNKFNPDPNQRVGFGWQTWDEMMAGYVNYTLDHQNLAGAQTSALR